MKRAGLVLSIAGLIGMSAQSVAAFENPTGFYIGGALGVTEISDTVCDELASLNAALINQLSCDEKDSGWKLFAGWQPIKWVGVEAGYADLGSYSASGGATNVTAEVDGGFITATFTAPVIETIGLYGKLGAYAWDSNIKGSLSGVAIPETSDDGTSTIIGAGFRFPITDSFGVRLEWERYLDIGDDDNSGGETDLDLFSANAIFSF